MQLVFDVTEKDKDRRKLLMKVGRCASNRQKKATYKDSVRGRINAAAQTPRKKER